MDRRRLPPTLKSNRGDIQDLNERANLIKIINSRENALKKRKELMGEYNEIMKRLYKAQKKKASRLRAGRGGVRTSRSWERRQQERFKRGERRKEGEDEPEIIGEEVKKGEDGSLRITYRDYEEEENIRQRIQAERDIEQLRIEGRQAVIRQLDIDRENRRDAEREIQRVLDVARLDQIRQEDRQLRFDEKERDRQDRIERDRVQFNMQREFRNRDDQFKAMNIEREDANKELDRIIEGRKLDYTEASMKQGQDFMSALLNLDNRLNRRFDAAEEQFKNLVLNSQSGVQLQDLRSTEPRVREDGVIELPPLEFPDTSFDKLQQDLDILGQQDEVEFKIPTEQQPDETGSTPIVEENPLQPVQQPEAEKPRIYAEDLPPKKEIRKPRGEQRSYKEDLELISEYFNIPAEGTPERVEFDNSLTAGDFEGAIELQQSIDFSKPATLDPKLEELIELKKTATKLSRQESFEDALVKAKQEAVDLKASADEDRKRIQQLQDEIFIQQQDNLNADLKKIVEGEVDVENPLHSFLKLERQESLDKLTPGENFVDVEGDIVGAVNPMLTTEEKADLQIENAKKGLLTIGTQQAIQQGIVQSPKGNTLKDQRKNLKRISALKRKALDDLTKSNPELAKKVVGSGSEINYTRLKREDPGLWKTLVPLQEEHLQGKKKYNEALKKSKEKSGGTAGPQSNIVPLEETSLKISTGEKKKKGNDFIPGKYEKQQEVMYFRKDDKGVGNWLPAKILEHKSDDAGEVQLTIQRTTGRNKAPVETIYNRVIAKPTLEELLKQNQLREGLKSGILKEGESRKKDKKSSFWEDRDKYVLHNNTAMEFRGIKPFGKSVINYHKENQYGYDEHSYYHTPIDDDGTWLEKKTRPVIAPRYLEPALQNGLLRLEKLDEKVPYKKPSKLGGAKGLESGSGRPDGIKTGFLEVEPSAEPGMLSNIGAGLGAVAGGVAGAGAGLISGAAGAIASQLPTPYEAGSAVGSGIVNLVGAGAGLVSGALSSVEEEPEE